MPLQISFIFQYQCSRKIHLWVFTVVFFVLGPPRRVSKVDFHCCVIFFVCTRVKFTFANKIEAMFERPRVYPKKSSKVQILLLRATFHTLPLFYLRTESYN